jgi:hypothetical protein
MVTTPDIIAAQRKALRRNIERYSRLLETELTEIERANLHKRMAEDWAVLCRLNQATAPISGDATRYSRASAAGYSPNDRNPAQSADQ